MILIGIRSFPVTITSGTSLSAAMPLGAYTLTAISMSTGWDAAALTFQGSFDGGTTWQEIVDASNVAITFNVAANTLIQMPSGQDWFGINMIKVRSGTSGAAVNQTADRTLSLIGRLLNH